jgi:hypothetical protein
MEVGMKFSRVTAPVVVFFMVVTSVFSWPASMVALEDVNGDLLVDVLDLQALMAEALDGTQNNQVDLNRDGCIDILDLQILLARAIEPETTRKKGPTVPDDCNAITLSALHSLRSCILTRQSHQINAVFPDLQPAPSALNTDFVETSPTLGLAFICSPHAPPLCLAPELTLT